MATSTGKRDNALQVYKFTGLTSNTASDLATYMTSINALIPGGSSVIQIGGGSVGTRCTVIVSKVNVSLGGAFSVGSYETLDNIHLKLTGPTGGPGTWSVVT